jgi:hypothetical protein
MFNQEHPGMRMFAHLGKYKVQSGRDMEIAGMRTRKLASLPRLARQHAGVGGVRPALLPERRHLL